MSDSAWLNRSVQGWIATRDHILEAEVPSALDAIIFDTHCELQSSTAMLTGQSRWSTSPILGSTLLVGDQTVPVGVISAAIGDNTGTRFVMSVPSVWAANGVSPGNLGLENLMSAVLMHEATHVFQMKSYGRDIGLLQTTEGLSDEEFNDDAIQARFEQEPEFAASIARETDLFFSAASASDDREALRLARLARDMMKVRAAKYFVGDQSYQLRAEDLWLTMEGSAQWAGYRWLQLPRSQAGGGFDEVQAMKGFGQRGSSWTQLLGLAITLTVDRLQPSSWKKHVFGDGNETILELLDNSITQQTSLYR